MAKARDIPSIENGLLEAIGMLKDVGIEEAIKTYTGKKKGASYYRSCADPDQIQTIDHMDSVAIDFDKPFDMDIAEKVATIIKLAKVIFIVPLVFLGTYLYKEGEKKFSFPFFIIFFLLAMFLNSKFPEFDGFSTIKVAGKKGLQISLFLIGTNLSIKNLKAIGIKPFLYGFVLWMMISISTLIAILYFIK